ncbi:MAG: carbamate kinase [Anaerofustis stercorihominis]|nr:carbamate kinase [Anaerofustis stercorihominis]
MKRIVIALGGNALGVGLEEQIKNVKKTTEIISGLLADKENEYQIVLTHGNGPQVGMIKLAFEKSGMEMPLTECCAMSQGYIGYHLQSALNESMSAHGLRYTAQALITQVLVDKNDPAFVVPTKPIGSFYSLEEASRIMSENPGIVMKEDSGRGYRRVVASPKPVEILEKSSVLRLLDEHHIVITCGGGGIPVCESSGRKVSVECIVDKDLSGALLAKEINADIFCILTAVDNVYINYNKPNQQSLGKISYSELERYVNQGHFADGSMLPKVMAAMEFVSESKDKKAVISSLENMVSAINGESGTTIYHDKAVRNEELQPVM